MQDGCLWEDEPGMEAPVCSCVLVNGDERQLALSYNPEEGVSAASIGSVNKTDPRAFTDTCPRQWCDASIRHEGVSF